MSGGLLVRFRVLHVSLLPPDPVVDVPCLSSFTLLSFCAIAVSNSACLTSVYTIASSEQRKRCSPLSQSFSLDLLFPLIILEQPHQIPSLATIHRSPSFKAGSPPTESILHRCPTLRGRIGDTTSYSYSSSSWCAGTRGRSICIRPYPSSRASVSNVLIGRW